MKLFNKGNKFSENETLNVIIVGEHDNIHYTTKINSKKQYDFTIDGNTYHVDRKGLYEENSFLTKIKNKLTGTAKTWYVFLFKEVDDPITIDSEYNMFPKADIEAEGMQANIIVTAKNILNCIDNNVVLEGMRGLVPKAPRVGDGFFAGKGKLLIFIGIGAMIAVVFVVLWTKGMIPNLPSPFGEQS